MSGSGDDINIKVAVLQEQMANVRKAQEELKEDMDIRWSAMANDMKTIIGQQNEMSKELSKYRGFWGAIMLVASAIWAFVAVAWDSIKLWAKSWLN